ncbi:hypothetical protein [Kitasatospora sp. NPDC002965]|uniref:hypothetical protein n=1 Tax=Kitasatospora sp. NPDC002965 TaxID=3154775 RepID=UPI0033ACE4D4
MKDSTGQQAAEQLLRDKYGAGREFLDPLQVMQAVRTAACGYGVLPGDEPPAVPLDDVLAALTQVKAARARLDALELDLIGAARSRGGTWQQVADRLGFERRQAAEARTARLERAVHELGDRDPAEQRLVRARRRAADAWCTANAVRLDAIARRLADVLHEAWPQLELDVLGGRAVRQLDTALTDGADPVDLVAHLESIRSRLMPYNRPPLEFTGPRAEEAEQTRDALAELLHELDRVRAEVRSAGPGRAVTTDS